MASSRVATAISAALVTLALFASWPAAAQEAINPTARSVQEQQLLDALSGSETVTGRVSIPNSGAADLIKPDGRDWTATHNVTQRRISLWTIVGVTALLAVFFLIRGRIRIESGWSGRTILRFNAVERFLHWLTGVSFLLLALTGLNLVFGRYVILPLIGEGAFGSLTQIGKFMHNYIAWPFMLGLVLIFLFWIKDNIPSRLDARWLAKGGGFFSRGEHPPARRFNAGQKLIFWAVIIGGAILSYSGVMLLFPAEAGGPSGWQFFQVVHGVAGGVMTAVIIGHIYIATIGMQGAFSAMGSGQVDLNWAREHHSLWAEKKLGATDAAPSINTPSRRPVAPAE